MTLLRFQQYEQILENCYNQRCCVFFTSTLWQLSREIIKKVAKTRVSLNSMTNNSKNRREGFKVVVEDRWSLNSSGR